MIPTEEEMREALVKRNGKELQEKFAAAEVAICGLGGLGSQIAIMLARAGIGVLHLLDFDRVDVSNLNRQQYFADQCGQYKTDALRDNLARIAPYCTVKTDTVRITEENAVSLLRHADVICEAFDRADQKTMLVNTLLNELPETYLVAASGVAGLSPANRIHTRRVTARFFLCGDEQTDLQEGVPLFSSRVTVCAAHQAHAVLRILAGEEDGKSPQRKGQ